MVATRRYLLIEEQEAVLKKLHQPQGLGWPSGTSIGTAVFLLEEQDADLKQGTFSSTPKSWLILWSQHWCNQFAKVNLPDNVWV